MTTQQSGYIGPRDAERSQALVKFLAKVAFRGEPLFRSSRPDSIETALPAQTPRSGYQNCSGLLGRTPLRHYVAPVIVVWDGQIVPVF